KMTKEELAAQREKLGLGVAKPSEMIEGLEEAAKRAEKLDAREAAKRKGGGSTVNTALHVDETGKQWSRMVLFWLIGTVLFVFLVGALLIFLSSRTKISPEEGNAATSNMLRTLQLDIVPSMKPIPPEEPITAESAKAHLTEGIQAALNKILDMIKFQDPWGSPFQFSVEGDKVTVAAKPVQDKKGRTVDPITFRFRRK